MLFTWMLLVIRVARDKRLRPAGTGQKVLEQNVTVGIGWEASVIFIAPSLSRLASSFLWSASQELPMLCGIRSFIIVFTTDSHWSLSELPYPLCGLNVADVGWIICLFRIDTVQIIAFTKKNATWKYFSRPDSGLKAAVFTDGFSESSQFLYVWHNPKICQENSTYMSRVSLVRTMSYCTLNDWGFLPTGPWLLCEPWSVLFNGTIGDYARLGGADIKKEWRTRGGERAGTNV